MSEPDPLADYPVVVEVPVAWGDLDAFQHVNNTRYFRWFEDVRIATFARIGWMAVMEAGGPGPILARTSCAFRAPVTFPDTVRVGCRITELSEDRFTMLYRVVSDRLGSVVAEGDGRIISFDYSLGAKAPLPPEVRSGIESL